jgi:hypothetical protein
LLSHLKRSSFFNYRIKKKEEEEEDEEEEEEEEEEENIALSLSTQHLPSLSVGTHCRCQEKAAVDHLQHLEHLSKMCQVPPVLWDCSAVFWDCLSSLCSLKKEQMNYNTNLQIHTKSNKNFCLIFTYFLLLSLGTL